MSLAAAANAAQSEDDSDEEGAIVPPRRRCPRPARVIDSESESEGGGGADVTAADDLGAPYGGALQSGAIEAMGRPGSGMGGLMPPATPPAGTYGVGLGKGGAMQGFEAPVQDDADDVEDSY